MLEFDMFAWLIIAICAVLIGLTKTGIPGLGILAIPLMAAIVPARSSTGIVLVMLMIGDAFAIIYYRHNAIWSYLVKLLPWTVAGVVIGYFMMGIINDQQLKPIIGVIILVILGLNFWRNRKADVSVPTGLAAGITTMMANAAGPIIIIYFLAMRLPKTEFIGTGAWYYFILNWFKVPFSLNLGLITDQSLQLNALLFPIIAVGAVAGIIAIKYIPEKKFEVIVQILTLVAAINLLLV